MLAWASDILDALQYLHTRKPPVVHRDIKPGNIKITPEGRAVLVDFGLAKAQDSTEATATGARGLSPGFSPPEQYGSGRTDARSDLYSLGATLYALLGGQKPPDGLERALGQASLIPLAQLNPRVSARVAAATERALAIQPEGRFASAAEFVAALPRDDRTAQQALEQSTRRLSPPPVAPRLEVPPAQPLPGRAPPPTIPRARGRGWFLLAAPLILLLAGGLVTAGGLFVWRTFAPRPTATPTLPPATNTVVSVVEAATTAAPASATVVASAVVTPRPRPSGPPSPTVPPRPTAAPSQTAKPAPATVAPPRDTPAGGGLGRIAFVSERTGQPQVFLMNADGSNVVQLTHDSQGACQPAWSPDGQQFLFVAPCAGKRDSYPSSSIYIANADGSGSRPFITLLGGAYDPAWSAAGIAFVHPDSNRPQIYIAQADGSGAKNISAAHSADSQPSWSPDGKRLAFANVTRTGRPTIYWMFADGSFRPGFGNPDAVTRDIDASAPAWSADGQYVVFLGGNAQILVAGWDKVGFGVTTLTTDGPNAHPAWSPDGQWIVFESWRDAAKHDIYRMTFTGAQVTRLTNDPALDYQPAWRP